MPPESNHENHERRILSLEGWRDEVSNTLRIVGDATTKIAADTEKQNKVLDRIDHAVSSGDPKNPGLQVRTMMLERTEKFRARVFWTLFSGLALAGASALLYGIAWLTKHAQQ